MTAPSRRIVVADDDADIRRLVAFALRRRGFEVLEAGTGDEALALISAHCPDLAVLDVMMPGLTGIQIAHALRAHATTAGIPVMLLSAKGQASEIAEGLACGARAYLVKPFTLPDLTQQVADLLAA